MYRPLRQASANARPPLCQPQVPCRKAGRGGRILHHQPNFSLCRRRALTLSPKRLRRYIAPCRALGQACLRS